MTSAPLSSIFFAHQEREVTPVASRDPEALDDAVLEGSSPARRVAASRVVGCAGQTPEPLDFYTIDVEGGKAVLIVSPARESMLIDVGWPKSPTREASTDVSSMR